jgi:hypothetical protein
MIFGHLPAGFICSKLLYARLGTGVIDYRRFLVSGMAGSVAPDLDLVYFFLFDHRQHHHHTYWSHYPLVWLALLLISLIWLYAQRGRMLAILMATFSLNGLIHMVLDTLVGDIIWLAPFDKSLFSLFIVPAKYSAWWFNFLLHWSVLLEVSVVAGGLYLWRKSRNPDLEVSGNGGLE